jgi:hypothetical protein
LCSITSILRPFFCILLHSLFYYFIFVDAK